MYKQFSSVLSKPCSSLSKSSQETATDCSQYTVQFCPNLAARSASHHNKLQPVALNIQFSSVQTLQLAQQVNTTNCNWLLSIYSSVLSKPCSSLSKSSQQTATRCSQYTVGYIWFFNAISSTTLQFHSPMPVSCSNYCTAELSPWGNHCLYLLF